VRPLTRLSAAELNIIEWLLIGSFTVTVLLIVRFALYLDEETARTE